MSIILAFARTYSVMKKSHKHLREKELENLIDNIVDKTIIELNQLNKSYIVPHFSDATVLAEQMQVTVKMLHNQPPKIMKILLKKHSFRMSNMKLLTKI